MALNSEAEAIVARLQLAPLPHEGGFFRQTWCTDHGSAILFLVAPGHFSALHRLAQPELWHHYAGDPVELVQLDPATGGVRTTRLGGDVLAGEMPQVLVPAGTWQGARVAPAAGRPARGFALLGCTLAPPWDERGFELGDAAALRAAFPAAEAAITQLTR